MQRRQFLQTAGGASLAATAFGAKASSKMGGRVIGANDKINLAVIGIGGRGGYLARIFDTLGKDADKAGTPGSKLVAVCDVWQRRVSEAKARYQCDGTLDYREVLARPDVDAVLIATPDHWHAKIALEAMDRGKDVYLEKPMCHTIEEAKQLATTVRETKRVLQVGSQTTSSDQWHKAKKAIADGMIGDMLLSQGSYHRNSIEGEWNWKIDPAAGPEGKGDDYLDWKTWLGPAPKRNWDADRYFRFRKYWDYSGGIATDLFYHVVAPMNICWSEPQFPSRVTAGGGKWAFKNDREVPDTFNIMADFAKGHSLVLSSSMANSQHIPGLIRGHFGSIVMVEHGRFEGYAPHITVYPEKMRTPESATESDKAVLAEYEKYIAKFGKEPIKIPIEPTKPSTHMQNFLDCIRSRQTPTLDVETGMRAQVTITMAVQSFREGRVLYWDDKAMKVTPKAPRA